MRPERHKGGSSKRRRLTVSVRVRLAPGEAARLAADAIAADMSVSELIRTATLGPRTQSVPKPRPSGPGLELAQVLAQLGKVGSNLNQLARAANAGGWPSEPEIIEGARDVRLACGEIMRALGQRP